MKSTPLVLLPYRLEEQSEERLVVHALTADVRLELSPGFAIFLEGFASPRTVADFLQAHEDVDAEELVGGVALLCERGLLVDAAWRDALKDTRCDRASIAAFAFERAPVTALLGDDDVDAVFFGVPLDIATTGAAGARGGPAAVRFHSQQRSLESGRFLDEGAGVVRRVTLERALDVGDLALRAGEGIDAVLPRIATVAALAARRSAVLCSAGGDHSITYALLQGLVRGRREAGASRGLCVVHFDAHADLPRTAFSPLDALHSHATFMRHVIDDGLVERVVQIGLRNVVPAPKRGSEVKLAVEPVVIGAARAMTLTRADLLALVPADLDLYVTVDIDVIDPAFAPHTGTPLPCGLPPWRLSELVSALCEERALAGIDVVEVSGSAAADNRTAALAAHLFHHALLRRFGEVEA